MARGFCSIFGSRPVRFLALFLCLSFFLSANCLAQNASTGDLRGTVRDPKGAAIPNATVTARDEAHGIDRTVTAGADGGYHFLLLPPGTYSVTATAQGFGTLTTNNVVLNIGDQAELPLGLQIATTASQVTVNANAEIVETTRSQLSTTIDQRRIDNLPINGRNYINFTLTNSQIARDAAPSVGAIPTSGLNFGGVRARSNVINVDGADATDYTSGGTRSTVSQDAVQEFQIITNGFAPEYGRAAGGVVNIVTRSGTNDTHGSVYGYFRDRDFQAVNPFSTVSDPAYTRVEAGATLGGAIKKDRTYYFLGFETTRRQETGFSDIGQDSFGLETIDASKFYGFPAGSVSILGTAQQAAFLNAVPAIEAPAFQQYVSLIGSASSLATTGQNPAFLQGVLGPNNFASSGYATPASFVALNSLIGNFPISEDTNVFSARIDHKINDKQQLFIRFNGSPSNITGIQENAANQNFGENSASRTAVQNFHDLSVVGQHTWLLDNNKVNELRLQFSRRGIIFEPSSFAGSENPAVNIPGFAYFGKTPYSVVARTEIQGQLQDNFSYTRGNHTLKFGADLRYIPITFTAGDLFSGGDYTFGSLQSSDVSPALAGLPGFSAIQAYGLGIPQSDVQGIGVTQLSYNLKVAGAYVQDQWKATPRLTFNYGLRYDIEGLPTHQPLDAETAAAEKAFGISEGIRTNTTNFSPRVGFAYDPIGDGKTVVRGNFGIFYDHAPGNLTVQALRFNSNTVPLVILAGGAPCTNLSTVSPFNLNATNVFQGSLTNPNCLPVSSLGYQPDAQRFDPNSENSIFQNHNFEAQGFPLAILPSGLPADANFHTPYSEQVAFGIEREFTHDLSLNVNYVFTGGRHLNRPYNVNPVNPTFLTQNWERANAAVQAGTAGTIGGVPQSAVASPSSNPEEVATATGTVPCGEGPVGPYVTPALVSFFRKGGINNSIAKFLVAEGASQCVELADEIVASDGLGVGVPVPFGDMSPNITNGTSDYHALTVNLRKRFASHYEGLVSYTWSHDIDDSTDVVSASESAQNDFHPNQDRSTSTFDQRHRMVLSGVYQTGGMPQSGFKAAALRNITVAPIIEIASGRPFNIVTGQDTNFNFNPETDRPNAVAKTAAVDNCGNAAILTKYSPTGAVQLPCYIDNNVYDGVVNGTFNGSLGRNSGVKPYVVFTDLRIAKNFAITERVHLDAIADGFNLLNRFNVLDVNSLYTNAGQPTAAFDPRQFQFALRLAF